MVTTARLRDLLDLLTDADVSGQDDPFGFLLHLGDLAEQMLQRLSGANHLKDGDVGLRGLKLSLHRGKRFERLRDGHDLRLSGDEVVPAVTIACRHDDGSCGAAKSSARGRAARRRGAGASLCETFGATFFGRPGRGRWPLAMKCLTSPARYLTRPPPITVHFRG